MQDLRKCQQEKTEGMGIAMSITGLEQNQRIAKSVREFLRAIGVDLNDPDIVETPDRIARAWMNFLNPGQEKPKLTAFPTTYRGLIIRVGIPFATLCPHHFFLVPVKAHVAYIPTKEKLGLSKIPRLVKWCAARPIAQEELTDMILKELRNAISPLWAMVMLEGHHTCESLRGVEADALTVTSSIHPDTSEWDNMEEKVLSIINSRRKNGNGT